MQLRRRLHLVKAAAHARQFAFPDAAEASARAAALHAQLQRVADDGEAYFKRPVVKGAVDGAGERAQKKLEDCSIRLRYAEQGDPLFIVADGHGVAADIDMLRKCVALLWGTKGRADPGGVSVAVQGAWRRASRAGAPLTCLNHTAVHSREETTAERASAVASFNRLVHGADRPVQVHNLDEAKRRFVSLAAEARRDAGSSSTSSKKDAGRGLRAWALASLQYSYGQEDVLRRDETVAEGACGPAGG